ncbi:MAG: alkaline phosphatase family protein [Myxococcales bacterium]|nr:alkaline phosphatase family protein [Myxococcales bacterium]
MLLAAIAMQVTSVVAAPAERPYDHVVVVSFDGMRPDGMMAADAPNLHRLRSEGAWATHAETVGDSSTLPSHSSMLAGVEVREHAMSFDDFHPERGFLRTPTALYHLHDLGFSAAMFVAKPKLRHIALPGSLDRWSLPHWSCERVAAAAAEYLASAPAGLTFIHFEEPDDAGHRFRWMGDRYLQAIGRSDVCFGTVLGALARRSDRVLVIVTADHGGHGRRHGTHAPEDLHIPWLAWGPGVQRGDFDAPVRTTDTAATAMAALGVTPPPRMTGRPVAQALSAGPRTAPPEASPTAPSAPPAQPPGSTPPGAAAAARP